MTKTDEKCTLASTQRGETQNMSKAQFDNSEFPKEYVRAALKDVRNPFEIAVIGVGNYFNLATIIRTAHNFLCKRIYVVDSEGFYEKGTMGNHRFEEIFEMPMAVFKNVVKEEHKTLIPFEKRPGISTKDIRSFSYPENPMFVFGSEKTGIPDDIIDLAGGWDKVVSIPVYGVNNDLNVGVAASIVMYDWISKRQS